MYNLSHGPEMAMAMALFNLEASGGAARVMFLDFSSTFNIIKPSLLRNKMEEAGVDQQLVAETSDLS